MHKTAKYLAGVAGIVLCVAAVFVARHHGPFTPTVQHASPVQVRNEVPAPAAPTPTAADQPAVPEVADDPNVIPALPADATFVPDADLQKLSALVNLPNAEERHINKELWSRAVPIAQRLAQGPCDCEQRNWLTQFIQMGNDALAGSDDDYYHLATVMQKTARNDKQLQANAAFFNR